MSSNTKKNPAVMYTKTCIICAFLATMFAANPVRGQLQDYIKDDGKNYAAYQDEKSNLWGFREVKNKSNGDTKYAVRVKAQFDEVAKKAFKQICAVKKNGKWGYINMKGDIVIQFQYEEATEGYVKMNGKWGMIDEKGNTLIPCSFAYLNFGGVLHIASQDGKRYGYVDDAGKITIPFMYEECFPMRGNTDIVKTATGYEMKSSGAIAKVKFNGRYGVIDINNNYLLYPKFKDITDDWAYSSPYLRISLNGDQYGVADRKGRIVMPTYFRGMAFIGSDGLTDAELYENGRYVSKGVVNVINHTFKGGGEIKTYFDIRQNYITKKDSAAFGLYRNQQIKNYQTASSGYLAYWIALDFLSDTVSRETSWAEGISWLQKGIDINHDVLCAVKLSNILYSGAYNQPKDVNKSFSILLNGMSWLVKNPAIIDNYFAVESDEDEQDVIMEIIDEGFLYLGQDYMTGTGTEKNEQQAINWYEKGANIGSPSCAMVLGDLYYNGSNTLAKDPARALSYYENNPGAEYMPEFMYKAAKMYLDGVGTVKNKEKALGLLRKAALLYHKQSKELLTQLGEK